MQIDYTFPELEFLVKKMSATPIAFSLKEQKLSLPEKISLELYKGKDIDIDQIDISKNGLLEYQGQKIVIYIKDNANAKYGRTLDDAENKPDKLNRYHLTDCTTIRKMKNNNRYERYIATTRDDGLFEVDVKESNNSNKIIATEAKLNLCKYCITEQKGKGIEQLEFDSQAEKNKIAKNFDLKGYFQSFSSSISQNTKYTDKNAPESGYSKDWSKTSRKNRALYKYSCEKCRVNLSSHKYLLDTHHKNGVKHDESPLNLKSLCKECHSKEPNHSHYKIKQIDLDLIHFLRREQENQQI